MSSFDKLWVAAIDIETTQSGFAFSTIMEYSKNPLRISSSSWSNPKRAIQSIKNPTCILFNKDKVFDSFGYEAENKYSELVEDEEHQEWYFFKNFKTTLFNKKEQLSKEVTIYTADGKEMKAFEVFFAAIKFFRDHLHDTLEKRATGVRETDIQWVLTVPAIWDDDAEQFMREATEKTGICSDKLMIVAKPEAAFLFCMYKAARTKGHDIGSGIFEVGDKYMVVISEESTTEVTVYEVQHNGILKELYKAEGGDWGGNQVNASFYRLITDIVGIDVMEAFRLEYEDDFHYLFRAFNGKKMVKTSEKDYVRIMLPDSLLQTFSKKKIWRRYTDALINKVVNSIPKYKDRVCFVHDRLKLDAHTFEGLFNESCNSIIYHLEELLKFPNLKDVSSIIVVGHFADSPVFQVAMKEAFSYKKVIVPQDADLAILKGAVLFGHQHKVKFIY